MNYDSIKTMGREKATKITIEIVAIAATKTVTARNASHILTTTISMISRIVATSYGDDVLINKIDYLI